MMSEQSDGDTEDDGREDTVVTEEDGREDTVVTEDDGREDTVVTEEDGREDTVVTEEDIPGLLRHFVKTSHRVKNADVKGETIMERCILLFSKDYKYTIVPNLNGELCGHYPMKLIIPEFERDAQSSAENVESRYNSQVIIQKMTNARCARCRSRFVVPVILFQGKYICRSATLSGAAEMFGRSTTDYLLSSQNFGIQDTGRTDMFDKFRGHDIQLLKLFNVGYICDLMVEKKKTKFGMPISSSEKVDKENRYSDFSILCMPYPGCEFFKDWKDNSYIAETTMYDWDQALNDSSLDLPSSPLVEDLNIDWTKYTEWSLIELTQNYLRLLLQYIRKGRQGLLIHCISGWDRTPLFISLLRLSLWADDLIHHSLSATEILYLTLGYDWYLFGHDLPDRLSNEQEVLYFCFRVLKDIAYDDFSMLPRSPSSSSQTVTPTGNCVQTSRQQTALHMNHSRVDSEANLGMQGGVLFGDECLSYLGRGSTSSLNSISSSEHSDHVSFDVGNEEEDGFVGQEFEWNRTSTLTSVKPNQQQSSATLAHPASQNHHHCQQPISSVAHPMSQTHHYSSPISTKARRLSSDGQALSIKSNHFMGSPLLRASSPMCVPQKVDQSSSVNSLGSWQIISSADNIQSLSSEASQSNPSTGGASDTSHISWCNDALDAYASSRRSSRLEAVSQLFYKAYTNSVRSQGIKHSMGGGLTSLFDRFAEQVGLKGRPQGSGSSSRAVV